MDLFGGAKKTKKTKKSTKTTKTTKSFDAKKPTKSKTKGGNFLGAVGDLVAPTGWGPFATAAGLLALDRADAALRRGTKEKKEKMKGGKKMTGGLLCDSQPGQIQQVTIGINSNGKPSGNIYSYYPDNSPEYIKLRKTYNNWDNENQNIVIKCNEEGKYYYEVNVMCNNQVKTYIHLPQPGSRNTEQYYFNTFNQAHEYAKKPDVQKSLVKLALLNKCSKKPLNS